MTKTNQDIGGPFEPYYAGDELEIIVEVNENLTGASVEWAMSDSPHGEEAIDQSDPGVKASIMDGSDGEVHITLDEGVTEDMSGIWHHEVRLKNVAGGTAVVTRGTMTIQPRINE